MESNVETATKRAKVGPRTDIFDLEKVVLDYVCFEEGLGNYNDSFIYDIEASIRANKCRNNNSTEEFYRLWWFQKVSIFWKILIFPINLGK